MTNPAGRAAVLALAAILVLVPRADAQTRVQRFTLVIGANAGGAERPRLQYAFTDAERFARVFTQLGGVDPANEILLRQPKLQEVMAALDRIGARVNAARRAGGARTELLLYYSGHADEQGILLGDDRYSYRTLRDRLEQIPADLRMVVLDACASGAFTRIKSGRSRPAFLVDDSSSMRGHAFLTSSAATEAAQESDRIRASYFTHFLVSGFRGAADLSGDGKVTLSEAYQFAFNETLGRTVDTRGGPQHPSYEINMSGTGDVVMTDLRQTTATLVLGEDLDGRFFVRNARRELIVELYKPRGRRVELAVEPGSYEVRAEIAKASLVAQADVADGARVQLEARQFGKAAVEATRARGDVEPDLSVRGRGRFNFRWGRWRTGASMASDSHVSGVGGLEYAHYLREDFALVFGVEATSTPGALVPRFDVFAVPGVTPTLLDETWLGGGSLLALPLTLRWNPASRGREQRALKPFISIGGGPVFGWGSRTTIDDGHWLTDTHRDYRDTAVIAHAGVGFDFHVTRAFVAGLDLKYNVMLHAFDEPVGAASAYGGPQVGVTVGWVFGSGKRP